MPQAEQKVFGLIGCENVMTTRSPVPTRPAVPPAPLASCIDETAGGTRTTTVSESALPAMSVPVSVNR